jgi:surface antigen
MISIYKASAFSRRAALRFSSLVAVCVVAGGCSMSMGGMFGKDDSAEDVTGTATQPPLNAPVSTVSSSPLPSVAGAGTSMIADSPPVAASQPPASPTGQKAAASITPMDWTYARGALGLALTGPENTPPVPWANPDTGSRGNFAPSAPAEVHNGVTCRSFVASRMEKSAQQRIEGKACRTAEGHWDIAEVKHAL